ncbi:hypothetical protein VTJ49DRAFT_6630 [Mycothermus thermophilus]|uniref:Extracellular membrane protein CFEM domain-containing protein n=1 Tax=Humicola insolens TaxID=85995 RepID=A0ABR3V1L6_HUMIN
MKSALLLFGGLTAVGAQSTATRTSTATTPGQCDGFLPTPDDFPSCRRLTKLLAECATNPAKAEDNVACFCTQDMLNAMVHCKGEIRSCLNSYFTDTSYDNLISIWNDRCQPHLTTLYPSGSITTPTLASLTATVDLDGCKTAWSACVQRDDAVRSCMRSLLTDVTQTITGWAGRTRTVTRPAAATNKEEIMSSCLCQESHLSLASVCNERKYHGDQYYTGANANGRGYDGGLCQLDWVGDFVAVILFIVAEEHRSLGLGGFSDADD